MFPHARRNRLAALASAGAVIALTAACSSGGGSSSDNTTGSSAGETPSGAIKVVTWRTDLIQDGTFDKYAQEFEAKYPGVKVTFEGHTDYEGEVKTLMNTDDYGDVLGIIGSVTPAQLKDFFEPLGKESDLEQKYQFISSKSYDGTTYGIPVVVNAQGIVYNKTVWQKAGLTDLPKTPDEFVQDLQKIKATQPDTVPLYTNYKDGWPLTQWEGDVGSVTGDADAVNKLATMDDPWAAGQEHNVIDTLLYDVVKDKLTEADPTTTNWEKSKDLLATGKIGTMVLGSWAISQMQAAADKAGTGAATIGYMPFPVQVDGKWNSVVGPDYNQGINIHSKHKAAARAWIDWFNNESGFAESQGGLSPVKGSANPATLKDFTALGVQYLELKPAEPGKESLVNDIDKQSEIGIYQPDYRKRIVDAARGASKESLQQIFDDLNSKWKDARASVGD